MATQTYEDFEAGAFARHEHPWTSKLSTLGDALWLGSIVIAVVTRNGWAAAGVFLLGTAVASGAHLFQPGTLKHEYVAIFTHPIWATRAEIARVTRR
jgi:hypothetical protein